jgi:alpha-1,6-mannosyltransferase
VTLTAAHKVYALGAIMLAAMWTCSRSDVGAPEYLVGLGVAGIAYLLTVGMLFRTRLSRKDVFICLALAALWRIPFLMGPIGSDDDMRRYLWDGRVQHLGYNPYNAVPADPALAALHTPETRGLNHPDLPSPYPAGAELFFRGVTAIHESIFAFKVAFVLCDFGIAALLYELLRRSGRGEHWVLAYAWHPLLAINVAGSGHIDIVGVLLLLLSVVALGRGWRTSAAVTFALAIAVKFLPVVLTPLYWRRVRSRDALLASTVFALLYVPFLQGGRIPVGSLATYVHSFRFNDPVFSMLDGVTNPRVVAGGAVLIGLLVAVWFRSKPLTYSADKWAWPMAASLICAPVVYPWYLLWLLPFVGSISTLPLVVWTISILPTYIVWHLRSLGQVWQLPKWVMPLEYGAVVITSAIVGAALRKRRRPIPAERDAFKSG